MRNIFFNVSYVISSISIVAGAENAISQNNPTEIAPVIQKLLEEHNEKFFFPLSIRLDLLQTFPEAIPVLAQWMYEEWHPYDASLTKEKLIHSFQTRLSKDTIPITFVVSKNGTPIGTVSLKKQTSPELADFPENSLWMGGLQVASEERNQGLGTALFQFSQTVAEQFGFDTVYFYTSNPTNVPWYLKRGAEVIEERSFRNHNITIMKISQQAVNGN